MRYGVLVYNNPNCVNIGDAMQIIAVKNLYKQFGINEKDIIRIDFYDLQTYHGEKVILPICFPFYGYNKMNKVTCFSDDIIPIFLALSLYNTNLDHEEIEYLKKYQPIGCRDQYTAEGLSKKGIKTYLNGCMTLTLDINTVSENAENVYCIDISDEVVKYIPNNLKENTINKTHVFNNVSMDTDEYASALLMEYKEKAKLVITSRLHAAVPCFAIGIPVVFVHPEYSYRFSWLEDVLPVYLPDDLEKIDWKGFCLSDNENAKKVRTLMIEIAKARIIEGSNPIHQIEELQTIYDSRRKRLYSRGPIDRTKKYIQETWEKNKTTKYAIWGISQVASSVIDYIESEYPLARLVQVIDATKTEEFYDTIPSRIEAIDNINDLFVFVTADAVNPYAINYFNEIGKDKSSYFLCWEHLQISKRDMSSV